MFLGSLRVQTSQDFIQILGLLDDLIGTGININTQQLLAPPRSICWHAGGGSWGQLE